MGGIKPGCFKIGNTGGMIDNILASKLYQPGSVAYVTRSGGLSNELNNIIRYDFDHDDFHRSLAAIPMAFTKESQLVAIDILDRLSRSMLRVTSLMTSKSYAMFLISICSVKIIVLLGESGGLDEYEVIKMMSKIKIKKPIIAWCIGTCAKYIKKEVGSRKIIYTSFFKISFGHAGSGAASKRETAIAKNEAFRKAGFKVPKAFDGLGMFLH